MLAPPRVARAAESLQTIEYVSVRRTKPAQSGEQASVVGKKIDPQQRVLSNPLAYQLGTRGVSCF